MTSEAPSSVADHRPPPPQDGFRPADAWGRLLPAPVEVDWAPRGLPSIVWSRVAILALVFAAVASAGLFLATGTSRFASALLDYGYIYLVPPALALLAESFLVPWRFGITERGITFRYLTGLVTVPWTLVVPETIGHGRWPALCFVHPTYGRTNTVRIPATFVRTLLGSESAADWARYRRLRTVWTANEGRSPR